MFDVAPSGYPQNFTAMATTPRSAVLTWDPPQEEHRNGIIVNYTIDITVASSSESLQVYSSTNRLTLSTLRPYRTYFCVISASTVIGRGPPSTVFTLTTPEDCKFQLFPILMFIAPACVCTAPTGSPNVQSYSAQDSSTIVFSWSPPDANVQNGVIREYRIQALEVDTGNTSSYISFSTSIEISSLHPDYTYQLTVAAFTVGIGPYSGVVNITTPEDGMFAKCIASYRF